MVKLRVGKIILYYLGDLIKGPYKGKRMARELEEEVNERIRGHSDEISDSENRRGSTSQGTQTACRIWKRRDIDFFLWLSPEGIHPCQQLGFIPVRLILEFLPI